MRRPAPCAAGCVAIFVSVSDVNHLGGPQPVAPQQLAQGRNGVGIVNRQQCVAGFDRVIRDEHLAQIQQPRFPSFFGLAFSLQPLT